MAQTLRRPITRLEALELAYDMLLLDTPEHVIRGALMQYGFAGNDIDAIIREARDTHYETTINPRMMAFSIAFVTLTLMLLALLITQL